MNIILIFGVIIFSGLCNGYRILGVFPFSAKSHNIVLESLMIGLARRGHRVDVVTHFPLEEPVENYNVVLDMNGAMENLVNNYTMKFVSQITGDVVTLIAQSYGNRLCEFMGSEGFQKLIKHPPNDPPYDLVITEAFGAHCYMGLGYVFKVPVVAVSSAIEYPWVSNFIGNDDNLATVPNSFIIAGHKMSLWERLKNVLIYHNVVNRFHRITDESQTESMRKYLDPNIPNIREVEKNVALTLVNNHPVLFGVKPITPSLIQIGGIHVEVNNETLPAELKEWMDDKKSGVVYFSFGSMVLIETMSVTTLKEFYNTFEKIAPVSVLIKIVDHSKLPPGLPKNVKILPWIPQQAVLAHPNTKVFITHGGLGGVLEALYYGIPMVGVPLFGDQFRNVANFVTKEIMIRIDFDKFSGSTLESALDALLHNPAYKEKADYYSRLFRDNPLSPMNLANFWIEYVIRNGPNALKPITLEFSWWELALLDVYGLILLALITAIVAVVVIIRLILIMLTRKFCGRDCKKEKAQ